LILALRSRARQVRDRRIGPFITSKPQKSVTASQSQEQDLTLLYLAGAAWILSANQEPTIEFCGGDSGGAGANGDW